MTRRCAGEASGCGTPAPQFLDLGTGIPTEPNLHQVVQEENPRARVLYVDNDPIVLAHARALMNSSPEGRTACLYAAVTEPESTLRSPELARTLDLSRPVALSVLGLLHFVPDESDAYGLMEQFTAELLSGSALVVSHATGDFDAEAMEKVAQVYRSSGTRTQLRSKEELTRFFSMIQRGTAAPYGREEGLLWVAVTRRFPWVRTVDLSRDASGCRVLDGAERGASARGGEVRG